LQRRKRQHFRCQSKQITYCQCGPDLKIDFTDCSYTNGTATLDGSKSYDPNNNITVYSWVQLYGPSVIMSVKDAPKALLERLRLATMLLN
jgi:hypothetical protein